MADTHGTPNEFMVTETDRFELRRNGELIGFASYRVQGDAVMIPHVETLWEHRGQGHAGRLMDGIVEILYGDGRSIVPLCSFAAMYMRDHPEHKSLLQAR